jgi:hypothetical protein
VAASGATSASSSPPAEERAELEHVREVRDRRRQRGRDARDQDVAVHDVADLVGEHAAQLARREQVEHAGRDRHHAMPRVAPGREGVRVRVVDQVHAGRLNTRARRQLLDDPMQPGRFVPLERARPVHREHDAVREEVGAEVHQRGQGREQVEVPLAERAANRDEPGRERPQQQDRLHLIPHVRSHPFPSYEARQRHGIDPIDCLAAIDSYY